jgi:hypothetical protein
MGYPSVYPTGTTIYHPDKCWNGYTIFQAREVGASLIDMNGNVVQVWEGLKGFPNSILPGGYVMGSTGDRPMQFGFQDQIDLVQVDWDGNVVWKFDTYEYIEDPGEEPIWMARQHHDFQREGCPVGYYVPGMEPLVDRGNTLMVCHKNLKNPKISDKLLLDDTIIEVTWDGEIVWEWICSEHFDELGFSEAAKNIISRNPSMRPSGGGMGSWMHMNSMSVLGPNRWYEGGDERFHPDNIIWDGRQTNIIAITDKKKGSVVWRLGPDFDATPELRELGWIIGQHHAHMIPKGLPGEGNILVFDNGGWAGYGLPNPGAPTGYNNALRDYSRVLEFDPITFKIAWQFTPELAGFEGPANSYKFYSPFISSAQRLPNGNTLITEGSDGRIIEVTPEHKIVWEYISPFWGTKRPVNILYRSYRVPYEWIPQLAKPEEKPIERIENSEFSITEVSPKKAQRVIKMEGVRDFSGESGFCVLPEDEE